MPQAAPQRPPLPGPPPTEFGERRGESSDSGAAPDTGAASVETPAAVERAASELDGPPPWLTPPREGHGAAEDSTGTPGTATGPADARGPVATPPASEAPAWLAPPASTSAERSERPSPQGEFGQGEQGQEARYGQPGERPGYGPNPTYGDTSSNSGSTGEQRRPETPYPYGDRGPATGPNFAAPPSAPGDDRATGHGSPTLPQGVTEPASDQNAHPGFNAPHGYGPGTQGPPSAGRPPIPDSASSAVEEAANARGRHRLSPPEGVGGGTDHRAPVSDQPSPGMVGRDPNVFAQQPADPRAPGWQQPVAQPPAGYANAAPAGYANAPATPDPNAFRPAQEGQAAPPYGPGNQFQQGGAPAPPQQPDMNAPQWNTGGGGSSWGQAQPPTGPHGQGPSLDDVPLRRAKRATGGGWRKAVHHMSGGAINPGMSAEELRLQELVARIRQPVRGDYRIAVLSLKGGVGKTTTTMGLGSIFASIRGDRVIAVDANPDFGTLSQRVSLQTRSTVRDLLLDPSIERYSDVRRHTSQATSRLEVLASERDPAASESFNDEEYRAVTRILQRFYNVILTDCGTGLMHSAMTGVLDLAHSLVLVSSAAIDGARSAAATLDWLSLHGHDHLVRNAVVVINLPREGSPNVGVQQLREYFLSRCRAVHIIPYDQHLSEGAEIDLHRLSKQAKRAYVELSATVADEFGVDHRRYH